MNDNKFKFKKIKKQRINNSTLCQYEYEKRTAILKLQIFQIFVFKIKI